MSFSELFDTEFKDRNKSHFSAIVRVALSDGEISIEEQRFLDKLAKELEILDADYKDILANPTKISDKSSVFVHQSTRAII